MWHIRKLTTNISHLLLKAHSTSKLNARNYITVLKYEGTVGIKNSYKSCGTGRRFLSSSDGNKCWKCGELRKSASDLFCRKCQVILSPQDKSNYFKVFNLNDDYDLDQKLLTSSYRKMQSLLHPDKFTNKTPEEKEISQEYSSLVNKAYNTLQTPLSRALHLLKLNQLSISEDDKATDPEFLMEIMELNEELEEATTAEGLRELERKNRLMLQNISKELSTHFKALDINKAKESVIKMKYYNSLDSRIHNLLREKGIVD